MPKSMPKSKKQSNLEQDDRDSLPQLAMDTLFGDVRDAILSFIRNLQKPWQKMSEHEQRALVEQVSTTSSYLVNSAVRLVSSDGRKTVDAQVDSITIKDGVKVTLKCSKKDAQELGEAQGKLVLLVTNQADEHMGEKAPAHIDKDQSGLQFQDEEDVGED